MENVNLPKNREMDMVNQNLPTENESKTPRLNTAVIVGVAVAAVIICIALWYSLNLIYGWNAYNYDETFVEQAEFVPLVDGNATSDIQNDLDQIPNDSAVLTQDLEVLDKSIRNL